MTGFRIALVGLLCLALSACVSLSRAPAYSEKVLACYDLSKCRVSDIERRLGEPKRMLNVEGLGYYGYDEYGFFFDNVVFFYGKGGKERIKDNPAKTLVVDYTGKSGLMGIVKKQSSVQDVESILGKPKRKKEIKASEGIYAPFAGMYYLYTLKDGLFGVRFESDKVESLMVISAENTEFQ